MKPKATSELLVELSEYAGTDKIVTSYDMKSIINQQPKVIPVM